MSWMGLHGHDEIVERFRNCLAKGRLGSAYLFAGPEGIGKRSFALRLAQSLFCLNTPTDSLVSCGGCPTCQQVAAQTHSDLLLVSKPKDRNVIPIEMFIGPRERRMREGLCPWIALKPTAGSRRIAIIDDADFLNVESGNSLLKTLEEPPPRSLLILVAANPSSQLPTIQSRCQIIHFQPLVPTVLESILQHEGLGKDTAHVSWLAGMCGGSLARARQLSDPEFVTFRDEWYESITVADPDLLRLAARATEFVDAGGKDAPRRRLRLGIVIDITRELYQQTMRAAVGAAIIRADQTLITAAQSLTSHGVRDAEACGAVIEACLTAQHRIDAYAQTQTILQWWLDQLGRITRAGSYAFVDM